MRGEATGRVRRGCRGFGCLPAPGNLITARRILLHLPCPPLTCDAEILRAPLGRARELGADVAGAAGFIDCPSAVADGCRGIYIIPGLYHDPGRPELDHREEGRGTPGDRIIARIGRDLGR